MRDSHRIANPTPKKKILHKEALDNRVLHICFHHPTQRLHNKQKQHGDKSSPCLNPLELPKNPEGIPSNITEYQTDEIQA